ncbi:MAG: cytochrome c [Verrucomicrobia bacterium]|nr:cytochrome c [Verrucomicrobiota bacterium]
MKKLLKTMAVCGTVIIAAGNISVAEETGEALYTAKCKMCHGATGAGDTPIGKKQGVKSFSDPEIVKKSDSVLFDITKNGVGKMPAYKDKLTDAQIKSLVDYMRSLQKK